MKNEIIVPDYLQPGDTIGLICPAGYMPFERTVACIDTLNEWGYELKIGKTVGSQHHYFSGTDAERLQDVQRMIDDPGIKAILSARGGYGSSRIIDQINWTQFLNHPKWFIGFSDITVFGSHLYQVLDTASIHGPMAGAFHQHGGNDEYVRSLRTAISGEHCVYHTKGCADNIAGNAEGPLLGGNLSLIAHLLATPTELDTEGAILFIEDVGEYYYNVDRMLVQLDRAGKLKNLAALVIGGFTQMKDTTTPLGKTITEIVLEKVAGYGYPVCFNFPVSHEQENYALKTGMVHTLSVINDKVTLEEKQL